MRISTSQGEGDDGMSGPKVGKEKEKKKGLRGAKSGGVLPSRGSRPRGVQAC